MISMYTHQCCSRSTLDIAGTLLALSYIFCVYRLGCWENPPSPATGGEGNHLAGGGGGCGGPCSYIYIYTLYTYLCSYHNHFQKIVILEVFPDHCAFHPQPSSPHQRHLKPPGSDMAETDEGLLCSTMYRVPSTYMRCCLDCGVCQGSPPVFLGPKVCWCSKLLVGIVWPWQVMEWWRM